MDTSAIDIFCGIGGLSFGLKIAGIHVVAGVDQDENCRYAFEENVGGDFLPNDVSEILGEDLKNKYWQSNEVIKILVGCAPCQPFSTYSNKQKDREKSSNWHLLDEFVRLISEANPDIVSMENVPNLRNQKIFKKLLVFLEKAGFFVTYSNVYCPDYGIPQKRRRLVLLASKFGVIELIPKTHSEENYVSLKQAIGHLPPIKSGETCEIDPLHRARTLSNLNLKRIRASKPNGTWEDWDEELKLPCHKKISGKTYKAVYGRMSWNEPSSTITTQFFNYGTGRFGHPSQNRALTLREGALLQSFPLEYKFYRNSNDISMKQFGIHIGNAVPVDLAYVIGKSILNHVGEHYG